MDKKNLVSKETNVIYADIYIYLMIYTYIIYLNMISRGRLVDSFSVTV